LAKKLFIVEFEAQGTGEVALSQVEILKNIN
jgi:hypothetical protein